MRRYIRATKAWIATHFAPLHPIYDAWMTVIAAFSWLLARVVLTIAFFTVFLLYGLILRLMSKDPMNRTLDGERASYWTDSDISSDSISEFKNQY